METEFEKRLAALINEYSKENDSDTPDFILARYLNEVLKNFNAAVMDREQWYNREKHVEDLNYKIPFIDGDVVTGTIGTNNTTNIPSADYGDNFTALNEFKPINSPVRERNFSPELEKAIDELNVRGEKLVESLKILKNKYNAKI